MDVAVDPICGFVIVRLLDTAELFGWVDNAGDLAA